MIRKAEPEAITLAIGDGANDVNMITAAHVGIGIKGLEGKQASRAGDYAIAEFKYLKNLILFYGRECYRKNALFTLYQFYKNYILIFPQLWYGLASGMSGLALYEPFLFQSYNIFFANLPMIIYGVIDREFEPKYLMSNPMYYIPGKHNYLFTVKGFWRSNAIAIIQSALICYWPFWMLDETQNRDGTMNNYMVTGMVSYWVLIFIANIRVWMVAHTFSVFFCIILFGSPLLFPLFYWKYSSLERVDIYGYFANTMHLKFWLTIIVTIGGISLLDYGRWKLQKHFMYENTIQQYAKLEGLNFKKFNREKSSS